MATGTTDIREIEIEDALDIRQAVLWPDHPRAFSTTQGDSQALHLGGFAEGKLVCVLSLYETEEGARIRKFATLPTYQGQGIGAAVFAEAIRRAESAGHSRIWLSARESALAYYAARGFAPYGPAFEKGGLQFRYMERRG